MEVTLSKGLAKAKKKTAKNGGGPLLVSMRYLLQSYQQQETQAKKNLHQENDPMSTYSCGLFS
jgi:hypothetical protein